jgi:hypothetical protein
MRLGTWSSASAPVESMTRCWSTLKPGISIGREPVAITTLLAITMVSPTCTRCMPPSGFSSLALPSRIWVWLPLSSVFTPPVSLPTMPPFHACSLVMSMVGAATVMPSSSACPIFSNVLAAWITAFDGMQPTLRHTPPQYSFSTTTAFTFSWPRRMPHGYPPGPAPITTASTRSSAMFSLL